jgi:hypothetical protein
MVPMILTANSASQCKPTRMHLEYNTGDLAILNALEVNNARLHAADFPHGRIIYIHLSP